MLRLGLVLCTALYILLSTIPAPVAAQGPCDGVSNRTPSISFAGTDWKVTNWRQAPPDYARNCFSPQGVRVSDDGVEMRIIEGADRQLYAAEIVSEERFGHGLYCFYLEAPLDAINEDLVLGLFLYRDDDNAEIDVEFSDIIPDWHPSVASRSHNAHYWVQPRDDWRGVTFPVSLDGTYSTHCINWQPDHVHFYSLHGHQHNVRPDNLESYRDVWITEPYTFPSVSTAEDLQIPLERDGMNIIVNLWPTNNRSHVEISDLSVLVRDLEFPQR